MMPHDVCFGLPLLPMHACKLSRLSICCAGGGQGPVRVPRVCQLAERGRALRGPGGLLQPALCRHAAQRPRYWACRLHAGRPQLQQVRGREPCGVCDRTAAAAAQCAAGAAALGGGQRRACSSCAAAAVGSRRCSRAGHAAACWRGRPPHAASGRLPAGGRPCCGLSCPCCHPPTPCKAASRHIRDVCCAPSRTCAWRTLYNTPWQEVCLRRSLQLPSNACIMSVCC
jgi:hypothetical protein